MGRQGFWTPELIKQVEEWATEKEISLPHAVNQLYPDKTETSFYAARSAQNKKQVTKVEPVRAPRYVDLEHKTEPKQKAFIIVCDFDRVKYLIQELT